jgi:hypothetical protein
MPDKSDGPLLKPKIVRLNNWRSITKVLYDFPPPTLTFDQDDDQDDHLMKNAWVFRGVGNVEFAMAPNIERIASAPRWNGPHWRLR